MAGVESILPISEISSYHSRWTIKARVTNKAAMRTFASRTGGGEGKVFHVELLDQHGGEIRATFFNNAVDKFFNVLEIGKCFVFSRGTVKIAKREFNPCNHRYELTFDKDAIVAPAADDANIASFQFNFADLRSVQTKTLPAKVDLCGIVSAFKPTYGFSSQAGKQLVKREITIVDDTCNSMEITLWGERAQLPDSQFEGCPVVALKGVLVKEWNNGRSGSLMQEGIFETKPSVPEAARVQQWWNQGGSTSAISAMSVSGGGAVGRNAKDATFAEVRQAAEALPETPETFNVVCRLALVQTLKQGQRQPLSYKACSAPREGTSLLCNKRVDENGSCPVCGSVGRGVSRLNVRCRFVDHTDGSWLTTFHEGAVKVLGMEGDEVFDLEKNSVGEENQQLDDKLKERYYQGTPMQLTVRAKTDTYQGEARPSVTCLDSRPVNRAEHGRRMLGEIHQMLGVSTA